MIFDWMENDTIDRPSQVLNVMYDLRMVTKRQLLAITGLGENNLNRILQEIRKKPSESPTEWIQTISIRHRNMLPCRSVYMLGKKAIQFVQLQRKQEIRVREAPSAQIFHFVGLNAILHRAIDALGRENMAWYPEGELADILYLQLKDVEMSEPDRKTIIRPDAMMRINDDEWFIEYDNSTEGPRQLEIKFHRYVELYERLQLQDPILWVTTSEKRRAYLQKNWDATMSVSYRHHPKKPTSIFVVEGEEVHLFREATGGDSKIPSLY